MIKKLILGTMQTNCYVVFNDNNQCFIVDPGANGQKIAKYIEQHEAMSRTASPSSLVPITEKTD